MNNNKPHNPLIALEETVSNFSKKILKQNWHLQENIDNPHFPVLKKIDIVYGLHLKNKIFGTYKKLHQTLLPVIEKIHQEEQRPARILEIASGLGFLTLGLWHEFDQSNSSHQVELTGSDIVPEYVELARTNALKSGVPVQFKVIDALSLKSLSSANEKYDLIINLHSLHHFTPFQLVQLFQAAVYSSARGFIAIDGTTGWGNTFFMGITAFFPSLFKWDRSFFHDAMVSALRMYDLPTLRGLAQIAFEGETTQESEGYKEISISIEKKSLGLNYISLLKDPSLKR